jgi:hypothetical protein
MTFKTKAWAALLAATLALVCVAAAYSQAPGEALAPAATPAPAAAPQPHNVTLELKDADVRVALTMLFKESGYNYVLTPDVQGRVTVSMHDVSWDQALRFVLESLGLTYHREDTIYYIERRQTAAPGPMTGPSGGPPPVSSGPAVSAAGSTAAGGQRLEVVKVLHSDPAMIAALFGGISIPYLYGGMGGGGLSQYGIGGYGAGGGGYGGGYGGGGYGGGGYGGGQGGYGGGQGGYGGGLGGYGGGLGGIGGGLGGIGGGLGGIGGGLGGIGGGLGGFGGGQRY